MELALAFSLRASRTDKLGPLLVPMLIEKLDHRRHHGKVQEEEESDTSVLTISRATT
jgi:hypothetical protein